MKSYFILLFVLLCHGYHPTGRNTIDALEFLKGFLEGLNEKGDIHKLIKCLKNIDIIAEKIAHALELIMTGDIQEMLEGIRLLIEDVQEYINTIRPCAEGFDQIKKLLQHLQKVDMRKLLNKIMQNIDSYVRIITQFIEAFRKQEFKLAGKYLGQFLHKLFLTKIPSPVSEIELEQYLAELTKLNTKEAEEKFNSLYGALNTQGLVKSSGEIDKILSYKGRYVDAINRTKELVKTLE